MTSFSVSISDYRYSRAGNEYEQLKRMKTIGKSKSTVKPTTVKWFIYLIGEEGYQFCTATFTPGPDGTDTFQQTQLFVLTFQGQTDFPHLTFEDVQKTCTEYHLPLLFAYRLDTLSDPYWGFSVVFLNETAVTDLREAEVMKHMLLEIFPEADRHHSSVCDLCFGGNKILYFDEEMPTISQESLVRNLALYWKNRYGLTKYKRKLIAFAAKYGLYLDDRKLPVVRVDEEPVHTQRDVSENVVDHVDASVDSFLAEYPSSFHGKKLPITSIEENVYGKKLPARKEHLCFAYDELPGYSLDPFNQPRTRRRYYRSDVLLTMSDRCRLYREFTSQDCHNKLSFQEVLGLASNLVHVETGARTFQRVLQEKPWLAQGVSANNWQYYLYFLKPKNPTPCGHFCPYCLACHHGETILSTCKLPPRQVERLSNVHRQLVTCEEAEKDFQQHFLEATQSEEKIWHVIRSQTSIGKTETFLQYQFHHPTCKMLIAEPTNQLKREVERRAERMGILLEVSPSLYEHADLLSPDVWSHLETLLEEGKPLKPCIEQVIQSKRDSRKKKDKADVEILSQYLRRTDAFYKSSRSAVTTHRRLLSVDLRKYDLVIVDEDYIFTTILGDRETVPLERLKQLVRKLPQNDLLRYKAQQILKQQDHSEYFTFEPIDYVNQYDDIDLKINLRSLCDATHFCWCKDDWDKKDFLVYTKRNTLPKGTKYVMLSATANEDICNLCFGEENCKFYSCQEAKLKGTLNQFYEESMSRLYLEEHPERLEQIKEWTENPHTITFMKYEQYCTDQLYFGNCMGCDTLKGENIDVIGTPHQPEWVYKLFAFSLGLPVEGELHRSTMVEHNGCHFRFATYDNPWLREIQFYIIETDLEQAVGRARLLRCEATVNVFSNFPLSQAILRKSPFGEK